MVNLGSSVGFLHSSKSTNYLEALEKCCKPTRLCMQGKLPPLGDLVDLHNVIVNAEDLRLPVRLSDQLKGSELNADVKLSMMQLLQASVYLYLSPLLPFICAS